MDANIGADRILMGGYDAFNDAERNVPGIYTTWCQCTECMNGAFLLLATYYDHVEGRKMREA